MAIESKYAGQATKALTTYLSRGQELLTLLSKNLLDEALEKFRERDAAFYNFQALDHLALAAGIDIGQSLEVHRLWEAMDADNRTIIATLTECLTGTDIYLKHLVEFKQKIGHYNSHTPDRIRFLKAI